MPVSVRARLPTSIACLNTRLSAAPHVPSSTASSHASRTCPWTSLSPSTVDSMPDATANRWATAAGVVVDVEVAGEVLGRELRERGEGVAHVCEGAVEALGEHVDLGAVARRQHDCLADVIARCDLGERLREVGAADGETLEELERRRPAVDSYDDDRHACSTSFASATRPSRTSSSIPESSALCQRAGSTPGNSLRASAQSATSC